MSVIDSYDRLMYRYDKEGSRPELPRRALRERIMDALLDGFGVELYGGHGMGKSYLIGQIRDDLASYPDVTVAVFQPPGQPVTAATCLKQIADALAIEVVVDGPTPTPIDAVIEQWLRENPQSRLVLLYDEVDGYVSAGEFARTLFNALESVRKKDQESRFGLLAAGGLGLVLLGTQWASPFVSRSKRIIAPRFDFDDMRELALPLELGDAADEILSALLALSGGIPFLVVYGMHALWKAPSDQRTPTSLQAAFAAFFDECKQFLHSVWSALGADDEFCLPRQMWTLIRAHEGLIDSAGLLQALHPKAPNEIDRALDVLAAAGLVSIEGNVLSGRPASIRLVPSVLNLPVVPRVPAQAATLRARLRMDLAFILSHVQRWGLSYFQQRGLIPEAAFQASIALGLASLDWTHIILESQLGSGRADITAAHPDFDGQVVIEVKLWGRNDYEEIREQVESYRVPETRALATVMISDTQNLTPEVYRTKCLADEGTPLTELPGGLVGYSTETTARPEWPEVLPVDHFLVKLLKRSR